MVTLDRPAEIALDTLKAEARVLAERAFAIIECFSEGDTMQIIRKVAMPDPSEDFYIVEQGHLSFLFEVHGECKLVVDIAATARLRFFKNCAKQRQRNYAKRRQWLEDLSQPSIRSSRVSE